MTQADRVLSTPRTIGDPFTFIRHSKTGISQMTSRQVRMRENGK